MRCNGWPLTFTCVNRSICCSFCFTALHQSVKSCKKYPRGTCGVVWLRTAFPWQLHHYQNSSFFRPVSHSLCPFVPPPAFSVFQLLFILFELNISPLFSVSLLIPLLHLSSFPILPSSLFSHIHPTFFPPFSPASFFSIPSTSSSLFCSHIVRVKIFIVSIWFLLSSLFISSLFHML